MAVYTAAQVESLTFLIEECAEVVQAATKCLRHGEDSYNPFDAHGPNNRDGLNKELGHVQLALRLAVEQGVVDVDAIQLHQRRKRETIAQWLHHFKPSPGGDDESHTTSNKRDD